MKRFLLLSVMFCIGVLHSLAQNFDYADENGVTWNCYASSGYNLSDGTWVNAPNVQINGASGYGDEVFVPSYIPYQGKDYPVLQMGSIFRDNKTLKKVTLPKTLKTLGGYTFQNCSALTEVENTEQITSCGYNAFYNCSSLKSIDLSSCEDVASMTFYQCNNLQTVTLKDCKSIGSNAFQGCSSLTTVGDISKCKNIDPYAFNGCYSLKSVDLSSCATLGESAFSSCNSLTSVGNTSLLTTINNSTFSGCSSLESIDLSNSTSIGDNAFSSCSKLQSIDLAKCKYIGMSAFNSCISLNAIKNMTLLTIIPNSAFSGCTSLKEIDLSNCTTIGDSAFGGCNNLNIIKGIEQFTTIPNGAFSSTAIESLSLPICTNISNYAFDGCKNLKTIDLPKCETIGAKAFSDCINLATVNLPVCKSIEGGGNISYFYGAFSNCTKLEKIELPKCISIGAYVFNECKNLSSINVPVIESIGERAFSSCNSLNNVSLPESVNELGYKCFDGNTLLTIYATNVPNLQTRGDSNMTSADADTLSLGNYVLIIVPEESLNAYQKATVWEKMSERIFPMGTQFDYDIEATAQATTSGIQKAIPQDKLRSVVSLKVKGSINSYDIMIMRNKMDNLHYLDLSEVDVVANPYEYYTGYCSQDSVLGPHSFADLSKLLTVKLPNSVKYINCAFANCWNLKSVVLPESLISMNYYGNDYNMGGMYYPMGEEGSFSGCSMLKEVIMPSCQNLGYQTFLGCNALEGIVLPKNLKHIGSNTFSGCSSLKSVILPDSVESIGSYAFQSCFNLKSIQFPPSLRTIGSYAFQSCSNLESISLPGLTTIAESTFDGCSKLQEVRVPSTLERIGDKAFNNCNNLNNVYTYTVLPINIDQNTFTNFKATTLWVPTQSFDNYYWNTQWSQFREIKEFDEPYDFFYLDNVFVLSKRFEGDPNIDIKDNGALKVVGTDRQEANLVTVKSNGGANTGSGNGGGGTIIADGNLDAKQLKFEITMNANQWYFLSFPFNIKFANIKAPGKYVIRKYDGEARANKGYGGWVDLAENEDSLRRGVGYIFQTSTAGVFVLNVEKDQFGNMEAKDISQKLGNYSARNVQDASWNFIGNVQTSYMDVADLGYDAPITYWNGSTYEAARPGDDELILHPFQAFFVQKPADVDKIEFKAEDRQTKEEATAKSGKARARRLEKGITPDRLLINLAITDGKNTDKTRVVFNAKKSQAYEMECDAAKFEAVSDAPQLYSVEAQAGNLAINERPMGSVNLGFAVKKSGNYSISASRMDQPMLLQDNETGATYDLTDGDYQFAADAGSYNSRFVLVPTRGTTGIADIINKTGVNIMPTEQGINFSGLNGKTVSVYSTNGMLLATRDFDGMLNLSTGVYLVKVDGMTTKVMVK